MMADQSIQGGLLDHVLRPADKSQERLKMVCRDDKNIKCRTRIPATEPPLLPGVVSEFCPTCGSLLEKDVGQRPIYTGELRSALPAQNKNVS
jgi:hypothetical protein